MRLIFKLSLTLLLLLVVDAVFRAGLWEPFASPGSHAGASIQLKRALSDPQMSHIDFVTLGSSRPEYGLDHEMLARQARAHSLIHANLSMPGSHWMTIGILSEWLQRNHPEIRGGIIAVSVQDFLGVGNGSYELGIVYPFHRLRDIPWMAQHVPINRDDVATFGTYSALFQWRSDIQDLVRDPQQRQVALQWHAQRHATEVLFSDPTSEGDMCAFGVNSLSACDRVEASADPQAKRLLSQCRSLRQAAEHRGDYRPLMKGALPADDLRLAEELVRRQLRELTWPQPPVVVLMPMPKVWTAHVTGLGAREWALSVLQPLVDEGRIHLVDATDFFDHEQETDCHAFFDFYHETPAAREQFTQWLLPQLINGLYEYKGP